LKVILTKFEEKIISNRVYFQQVQLPCNNRNDAKILKEHFTFPKLQILKFETNSMVDLKGTIILIKVQMLVHGNYFINLNYDYLLHTTFFHVFCLHTICFHE
jgi:hypothetical protein